MKKGETDLGDHSSINSNDSRGDHSFYGKLTFECDKTKKTSESKADSTEIVGTPNRQQSRKDSNKNNVMSNQHQDDYKGDYIISEGNSIDVDTDFNSFHEKVIFE